MLRLGARWSTSSFSFPIHGINKLLGLGARDRDPLTTTTTPPSAHNQQFARKKETEKKRGKRTYHLTQNKSQLYENAVNSGSGNNCKLGAVHK